jgi:NTP pyrophosphatase (non-canonical NTP hydrolase)
MHINELQKITKNLTAKIDEQYSGQHDADTTLAHLLEEFGELSAQIYNQKIGREKVDRELLESGFSDCIVLLLQLATNYDVDVELAIEEKIKKVKKRFKL